MVGAHPVNSAVGPPSYEEITQSLASCRSLRSLHIGYPPFKSDLSDRLCALFERAEVPFPHLQSLTLSVTSDFGVPLIEEQLPVGLAAAFSRRERYPSFGTLTVAVPEEIVVTLDMIRRHCWIIPTSEPLSICEREEVLANWRAFFSPLAGVAGMSLDIVLQHDGL